MITFNNFRLDQGSSVVDLTIPTGSIVYLNRDFTLTDQFFGDILYENFPISHARKSFYKKILCEIFLGQMLDADLSLLENMEKFARCYGTECIYDLPLKYFNIPKDMWKTKVRNLDASIKFQAECGISLLNTKSICYFRGVNKNCILSCKNAFQNIINAKVSYGRGIVLYTGESLALEKEIKIIL